MKIAFYAPFKPLGHKNPSGDLMIAREIVQFLEANGHEIEVQSNLRTRWIYLKPWLWLFWAIEFITCLKKLHENPPDVWLTYHTYYKAPDLLGPGICKTLKIKYVIFQGIYSTKRKRQLKTVVGFYLNRAALIRADHVFTNKLSDLKNLKRLLPESHITYIRPGIKPNEFVRDEWFGKKQREKWGVEKNCPIILTAAMFRNDVKTKGLSWLIRCCEGLIESSMSFHLVIAGTGKMENELRQLAQKYLPGHFTFTGKIPRKKMFQFYSSGDIFAFPGIRESLGMVYLEAQSCSLPVVAFKNGGIPEVVENKSTGFLVPMYDCSSFSDMLKLLIKEERLCKKMGHRAVKYVINQHDIDKNYEKFEQRLCNVVF